MRILSLLLTIFLVTTGISLAQPNIVFVLVDDMRWDDYGKGGHTYLKTPNIDRIANEGITFRNAFCATPLCSPSRANFLTGQYARHNGIVDNTARDAQSHQLETFPRLLDAAGYETAFFGKWHMGNDDSPRPGFDYWAAMQGQGEAINPQLNINGKREVVQGYVTDVLTDQAITFLKKKRTGPFLVYLSHKALHPNMQQRNDGTVASIGEGGFVAADRHKGTYATANFRKRPNYGKAPTDKPALMRTLGSLPPLGADTGTPEQTIRDRAEMMLGVDESLGKIMDLLTSQGQLDNTIIVVTGDHGYWYGEHGLNEERRLAYEESLRIPLLMRLPGTIKPASSSDEMVQSIDVAPTMLTMAGAKIPKTMDGLSLTPLFSGKPATWRKSIYVEYYTDIVFPRTYKMGYDAVRTERHKYIKYRDLEGMDELYDLEQDPYELNNLVQKPGSEALKSTLKTELDKYVQIK
jgi:N-acetylglucosamine-6-sulfatase